MRHAVDNPFTPGSDTVPLVWAGRTAQLVDWERVVLPRLLAGLPERGRTIIGEPGLGKSTLVRRIAASAEAAGGWTTRQVRLPAGTDPLKAVAAATLRLADQAGLPSRRERALGNALDRVREVAALGMSLTLSGASGPEPHAALTDLLIEIGRAAIQAGSFALIHIDEVQNVSDHHALSQLLISLGDAITSTVTVERVGGGEVERSLPIAVYLTGLPEFVERASSRAGATFTRRFATQALAPLSDDDMRFALVPFVEPGWEVASGDGAMVRVRMDPEAADEMVRLCHGEPFLFQLAGERAWYAGSGETITLEDVRNGWLDARYEATAHVERILDRLPRKEREFVEVMAGMAPEARSSTAIAQAMGYASASNVGPFAQRLDTVRGIIDRGHPYTFKHRALEAYLTTNWPQEDGT